MTTPNKPKRYTTVELSGMLAAERADRLAAERKLSRAITILLFVVALALLMSYATFRAEFGMR